MISYSRWLLKKTPQFPHAAGIKPGGRLVEDQQLRLPQKRRGQAISLPHPHRVGAKLWLPDVFLTDPQPFHQAVDLFSRTGRAEDCFSGKILPSGHGFIADRTLNQRTDAPSLLVQFPAALHL